MLVLLQLLKMMDKETREGLKAWMDACEDLSDAFELVDELRDEGVDFTETQEELFIQCVMKKNYHFAFKNIGDMI